MDGMTMDGMTLTLVQANANKRPKHTRTHGVPRTWCAKRATSCIKQQTCRQRSVRRSTSSKYPMHSCQDAEAEPCSLYEDTHGAL